MAGVAVKGANLYSCKARDGTEFLAVQFSVTVDVLGSVRHARRGSKRPKGVGEPAKLLRIKIANTQNYQRARSFCQHSCKFLICLVYIVASFKFFFVCNCCCLAVCIVVVILCVFVVLCVHCCFMFYFRCRTAGWKSVLGRSCDRPPRHRFFSVSLCL
jgi:hypothetical protein